MKDWNRSFAVRLGLCAAVLAAIALFFSAALSNLSRRRSAEGHEQLETALRRTAVACFAVEGRYPPSLAYMEEHYGIQINSELYAVDYVVFADNLMPDITVLEREP